MSALLLFRGQFLCIAHLYGLDIEIHISLRCALICWLQELYLSSCSSPSTLQRLLSKNDVIFHAKVRPTSKQGRTFVNAKDWEQESKFLGSWRAHPLTAPICSGPMAPVPERLHSGLPLRPTIHVLMVRDRQQLASLRSSSDNIRPPGPDHWYPCGQ